MKKVWKFPLVFQDKQTVQMPAGAHVLTAQVQKGILCIWALCDPKAALKDRVFRVAGTDHSLEGNLAYIDSVQVRGGELIFHVFEELKS